MLNVIDVWDPEFTISPGDSTDQAGHYAYHALEAATAAVGEGKAQGLVTGPINKATMPRMRSPLVVTRNTYKTDGKPNSS